MEIVLFNPIPGGLFGAKSGERGIQPPLRLWKVIVGLHWHMAQTNPLVLNYITE